VNLLGGSGHAYSFILMLYSVFVLALRFKCYALYSLLKTKHVIFDLSFYSMVFCFVNTLKNSSAIPNFCIIPCQKQNILNCFYFGHYGGLL
jgi:hypothetical protein